MTNYTSIPGIAMLGSAPMCCGTRQAAPTGAHQEQRREDPRWLQEILKPDEPVLVEGWPGAGATLTSFDEFRENA